MSGKLVDAPWQLVVAEANRCCTEDGREPTQHACPAADRSCIAQPSPAPAAAKHSAPMMTLLALEVGGTSENTSPVGFSLMRVRPANEARAKLLVMAHGHWPAVPLSGARCPSAALLRWRFARRQGLHAAKLIPSP